MMEKKEAMANAKGKRDLDPAGPVPGGTGVSALPGGAGGVCERVGFLPLFAGAVPGFSVEEHTAADHWWTGDRYDPWEWRKSLPAGRRLLYGKFFAGKAGYIARDWFPEFANWRRNGYDFDSLYEDELASHRSKKIMDLFRDREELLSPEVRQLAGFASGEKNFEGAITPCKCRPIWCRPGCASDKTRPGGPTAGR